MKQILLLFIILITLTGCKEDNEPQNPIDQLPPETQTGANTFGFLVNGKPINVTNTSQQTAIYQRGILQIGGGIDNSETDISVSIILENPLDVNTNYSLINFPVYTAKFRKRVGGINCSYDYPNTIQGFVKLTNLDQTNFIVSGTFEFKTKTDNCEDISITNGRFDLQYTP